MTNLPKQKVLSYCTWPELFLAQHFRAATWAVDARRVGKLWLARNYAKDARNHWKEYLEAKQDEELEGKAEATYREYLSEKQED